MSANQLFNIPVAAALRAAAPSPSTAAKSVGVITSQQSAITFAGAPAAVTLVWKVIGVAVPSVASLKLVPILLAIVVGMLIYWQSAPVDGTKKQKVIGFAFALINSFAIAAATLGIESAA